MQHRINPKNSMNHFFGNRKGEDGPNPADPKNTAQAEKAKLKKKKKKPKTDDLEKKANAEMAKDKNAAAKTDESNLKNEMRSSYDCVVKKTTTGTNNNDPAYSSESEVDDVLVEILQAAKLRRAEPLSAQNMGVDVYGKTPLPTIE